MITLRRMKQAVSQFLSSWPGFDEWLEETRKGDMDSLFSDTKLDRYFEEEFPPQAECEDEEMFVSYTAAPKPGSKATP